MIIIFHVIVILLAYSSAFWLDWRLVIIGIGFYYLQLIVFEGCLLSLMQFKGERKSFHEWYLNKLGLEVRREWLNIILTFIVPVAILALAILYQLLLKQSPLLHL